MESWGIEQIDRWSNLLSEWWVHSACAECRYI